MPYAEVGATHALHSPHFVMDESVLAVGARIHAEAAVRALASHAAAKDKERGENRAPSTWAADGGDGERVEL